MEGGLAQVVQLGEKPTWLSMAFWFCDEGKPNCLRCTASGRICGGYDLGVRFIDSQGVLRAKRKRRVTTTSIISIRPLSLGIEGSDAERQFFFSCRRATEAGVAMHLCSVSSFWTKLAPQLGHFDAAVKHSLVALGATYHLKKMKTGVSGQKNASSVTADKLELFAMRQYNRAIENVYGHLDKKNPKSIALVLVCCLIFVSLELLRQNNRAAIAHLRNGIQIIISALDIDLLSDSSSTPWTKDMVLSNSDLWDIITQFRNIEFAWNVFSNDVSLTLGLHLRRVLGAQPKPGAFKPKSITSVNDGYKARTEFMNAVTARYSELQKHQGDEVFWAQPKMQQELYSLRTWGGKIMSAIEALWTSPQAPVIGTWSSYSSQVDWLLISSGRTLVEMIPFGVNAHTKVAGNMDIQNDVTRGVSLAAKMHLEHAATGRPPSEFSLEIGLVAVMYWAWVFSTRAETKEAAMRILQDLDKMEGPWDAKQILTSLPGMVKPRLLVI
ncbi:C6 zinc finger domain-containing protein [Pochonia chlamydosporia 170]|uniref:C6 zinc finger domain-containing protein n=1 Tax=Pochonia chlamydosporia 170 TaxID=1380566 RepID=A0A179F306_METCM|nr:C6 zinc finger domain-containing protein [Pochonia chlamydosporia 170]OAQ59730.2 C6 zinc finger domain-containing protein [Pochonia chlamydosporia 170]